MRRYDVSVVSSGKPFENTRIAEFLRKRVEELSSRKSQREIALEAGYDKPNIISMFKRGETKVPFDKVPALAKALEVDTIFLLQLQMQQPGGFDTQTVNEILKRLVTENQSFLIQAFAEVEGGNDYKLTKDERAELVEAYKAIRAKTAAKISA